MQSVAAESKAKFDLKFNPKCRIYRLFTAVNIKKQTEAMRIILAPLVKFASKLSHSPLTQTAAEMSAAFSIIVPRRLDIVPAM